MNIIVVGPPGVGKGTQSARLARSLGLRHVAAGDLLRAVREQDAPLGHTARQYMDAGQLVPDDVTMRIIEQRLAQPDAKDGVILDGFPRTVSQARALDASCARPNDGSKGDDPDAYVERTPEAQAAIEEFHAIEIRGLRRAVTAVREWQRRFPGKPHDPVPQLVAYHEQAAARRAAYKPPASGHPGVAWGYPIAVVALLGAAVAFARRKSRPPKVV